MRSTMARWAGRALCLALCVALGATPASAVAHGVVGQRFFPTTFAVDDPFVNDELSLLGHSSVANAEAGGPRQRTTSLGVGYSKTILAGFGVELDGQYRWIQDAGGGSASGFGNLEATLKYQFLTSEAHEALLSVGVSDAIGGTGSRGVGAERSSTVSPTLFFGKGLGDLPPSVEFLRPVAITGVVRPSFPTQRTTDGAHNLTTLTWAFTVQYSLMYLQTAVKDIGFGAPFDRMVALVELPMQTCLEAGCAGRTTGSVNPGVAWIGSYVELGAAAEIPINSRRGESIGAFLLLHVFIDDLFPRSIGRPIIS